MVKSKFKTSSDKEKDNLHFIKNDIFSLIDLAKSDKGKENDYELTSTMPDKKMFNKFNKIPLKSEFTTREEIWKEVENCKIKDCKKYDKFVGELWLSKEDYEKRVEKFRKEILAIDVTNIIINKLSDGSDYPSFRGKYAYEVITEVEDLISKILLK